MSESVNAPDLNAVIGNLLANPEALSGMMKVIGNLRTPEGAQEKKASSEAKEAEVIENTEAKDAFSSVKPANINLSALAPLLSGTGALAPAPKGTHDGESDPMKRRRCLLEAIRPYLSPARCENLNLLLRILDVLSLLSPKK